jgi:hypothetical protein
MQCYVSRDYRFILQINIFKINQLEFNISVLLLSHIRIKNKIVFIAVKVLRFGIKWWVYSCQRHLNPFCWYFTFLRISVVSGSKHWQGTDCSKALVGWFRPSRRVSWEIHTSLRPPPPILSFLFNSLQTPWRNPNRDEGIRGTLTAAIVLRTNFMVCFLTSW